ncbi:MAG: 50S ribosomal protein L3 [Gemmatimonadota bacterium]
MPGMIGKKVGMTQIFDDDGNAVGATVLEVGPCPVVQIKTDETDGYEAIQLGFGRKRDRRATKPAAGHAARAGLEYVPDVLAEFAPDPDREYEAGQELTVDVFEVGQRVKITGRTKGKGFQGTVKRHNFGGSRASHGGSSVLRKPGSIGPGTDPSRVIKGRKMAGQMGAKTRTALNRRIVAVDVERNLLMIDGSVPGAGNNVVLIRTV